MSNLKIAGLLFMCVLAFGMLQAKSSDAAVFAARIDDELSEIPEPASMLLVGAGLAGLALKKRNRK